LAALSSPAELPRDDTAMARAMRGKTVVGAVDGHQRRHVFKDRKHARAKWNIQMSRRGLDLGQIRRVADSGAEIDKPVWRL
jgi:hypothetical protein